MEDMQEFTAYLRRLIRDLDDLEEAIRNDEKETALKLLARLQEDTKKDIEK